MRTNSVLNESFELPFLEEIQEMDRKRSQAVESLEIFNDSYCEGGTSRLTLKNQSFKISVTYLLTKCHTNKNDTNYFYIYHNFYTLRYPL